MTPPAFQPKFTRTYEWHLADYFFGEVNVNRFCCQNFELRSSDQSKWRYVYFFLLNSPAKRIFFWRSSRLGKWSTWRCFWLVHPMSSSRQFYSMILDAPSQNRIRCFIFWTVIMTKGGNLGVRCGEILLISSTLPRFGARWAQNMSTNSQTLTPPFPAMIMTHSPSLASSLCLSCCCCCWCRRSTWWAPPAAAAAAAAFIRYMWC